jgi:hypothetical protein
VNVFHPLAVFYSADGAEWLVRDYAGQRGRFCVVGPYTVDTMGSFRTLAQARSFIEERAGTGTWEVGK